MGTMTNFRFPMEDIVIYYGSLDELNSRSGTKKFKFAEHIRFVSEAHKVIDENGAPSSLENYIVKDLEEMGYEGIVDARTFGGFSNMYHMKGTPIVKDN